MAQRYPRHTVGRVRNHGLRGDLHVHTSWSDGRDDLPTMVRAAQALGHDYVAITDHSPRLRIAHGLDRDRLLAQSVAVDALADEVDLRIYKGIEVDILADGSLDQADDLLAGLDIVVASVHSNLRDDAETMTRRMVAAVSNPHTTVLGHPTGRLVGGDRGARPESVFDAEVVFAACELFGVAVEINCKAERQDPPDRLLRLADEAGCLFAISTDAHAAAQLQRLSSGWDRAMAMGIDPERIINARPDPRRRSAVGRTR